LGKTKRLQKKTKAKKEGGVQDSVFVENSKKGRKGKRRFVRKNPKHKRTKKLVTKNGKDAGGGRTGFRKPNGGRRNNLIKKKGDIKRQTVREKKSGFSNGRKKPHLSRGK